MSSNSYKASVQKEQEQQIKRRNHGLKTGFYVKYPDPSTGPYIIRASVAAKIKEIDDAVKVLEESLKKEEETVGGKNE